MENRFGVKDFFVFLFLAAIVVMIGLAMVQFDRQYGEIQKIKTQNAQLTNDVIRIQQALASGVVAAGGGAGQGQVPPQQMEVFRPLVENEKKPDYATGDWLVENFGTKMGKLTPLIGGDLYQRIVEYRVMETLVTRDPYTAKYIPLLAESWEIRDHSKAWEEYTKPLRDKGMSPDEISEHVRKDPKAPIAAEITFKIRRGVSFSDGAPMTADDVVFTFDWILNPEVNAPRERAYLLNLREYKADNPHQVTFKFSEPYFGSFETVGSTSVMSRAFYGRFKPSQFNERTGLLIGTGPYRLEDPENWTPGKPIELVRNERYWGVRPAIDRLVFREIEDESAEMVMFGNGQFDIMPCQPEQYEKLKANADIVKMSQHFQYPSPLNGYIYIGWNQRRKTGEGTSAPTMFDDARVRRAMTMLIDRPRIAKEVFLGYASVASGPFDPNGPQHAPDVQPWPFDVSRAKALLAEAGWTDRNNDGVIDDAQGRPLRFKLAYPSGSATYQRVVLFLKDSFAAAGITMEPDPMEFRILIDRIKQGDFDACSLGWGGTVESDAFQIFHSSQIKGQGDNRTNYVNPKLDALIERARRTLDESERMKVWHEVHRTLHEDQPYTFLFNRPSLVFINNRFANVGVGKLGLNYLRLYPNPLPWYVPKGKQQYTK